jgi:peptidoglycan/LPS O-acetylase OafA/YrhL
MFSYTIGILLNRLAADGRLPMPQMTALVPASALLIAITLGGVFQTIPIDSLAILIFPAILVAALSAELHPDGVGPRLGALSYPLYAMHLPMLNLVLALPVDPLARFLIGLPASFLAAYGVQVATARRSSAAGAIRRVVGTDRDHRAVHERI